MGMVLCILRLSWFACTLSFSIGDPYYVHWLHYLVLVRFCFSTSAQGWKGEKRHGETGHPRTDYANAWLGTGLA
jgi:hypothetical protein